MRSLEIHLLQTLPPSRVNRGENGEPKTSLLGGVPRTRVSSQSQKRQQRDTDAAKRTKLPHELILRVLGSDELRPSVLATMTERYGPVDDKGRLKAMVYLSDAEVRRYAELLQTAHGELMGVQGQLEEAQRSAKKAAVTEADKTLRAVIQERVLKQYEPQVTPQTALFGRFIAEQDDEFVQAATSYAHAISTHRDTTVNDFFSAVDDATGNSAHIGNYGLSAPTLYRYATLDLDLLQRHLDGQGLDLTVLAQEWVRGFIFATPQGGTHGAFATTLPEYVLVTYRDKGQPITLANAFTDPAYPREGRGLLEESIRKLKTQAAFNEQAYGHNGLKHAIEISLYNYPVEGLDVQRVMTLQDAFAGLPL